MKTFKKFISEEKMIDRSTRNKFHTDAVRKGLDGKKKFNSLGVARKELDQLLQKYKLELDNDSRYDEIWSGDRDVIGDKNKSHADIKGWNSRIVVTWEHLESGYEVIVYLS